ncbi:MAG: hypothetical protein M3Q56_10200 [Bacteroidota bacterium]|nr:hypothetical protein [Bacteroidota bacterium]
MELRELNKTHIEAAESAALSWLTYGFNKFHRTGFPHSRIWYLPSSISWRKPYPETTGYLIENFLDFNKDQIPDAEKIALQAGNWLCSIQSEKGYYYSGIKKEKISSFNTSQILFGLISCYENNHEDIFEQAASNAYNFLLNQLDGVGRWTQGLYVNNYFPAYYSRAIWPMLLYKKKWGHSGQLEHSLNYLFDYRCDNYFFMNAGFYPGQNPLSHNLAYTLEGFAESSIILQRDDIFQFVMNSLETLGNQIIKKNYLAGSYDVNWNGNYTFNCVVGQAQFASLFVKAFIWTNNILFKTIAIKLFQELLPYQNTSPDPEYYGSFASSIPNYGKYFPFQTVNWTQKFFLDACYYIKKIV